MSLCPSVERLELLLAEQLGKVERETVAAHVEECATCQERLANLVSEDDSPVTAASDESPDSEELKTFLSRLKQIPAPRVLVSESKVSELTIEAERPRPDAGSTLNIAGSFLPQQLGQYRILERLGRGGMGLVYRARHVELGKIVALKVLPSELMDEVNVARFKNEIRAVGRLDHPNIIGAHDAGEMQGVHFLVMALVEGTDLARLIVRHGRLSTPDACEVVRQAATGLQHAFDHGLVHRDVKPSNLILARDGVVKVLDLGIARFFTHEPLTSPLTTTGMILGTADYLAPEQWDNAHEVDTRADVYSLGCTLYQLLAGRAPFSGQRYDTVLTKMLAHRDAPVPSITEDCPEVPDALAVVLARMLAKNPEKRFSTPGDVAAALRPFTAGCDLVKLLEQDSPDAAEASPRPGPTHLFPSDRPTTARREMTARDGHSRDRRRDRLRWITRLTVAVLAGSSLILASAATYRWGLSPPMPEKDPPTILALDVHQYRGESASLLGNLAATTEVMRVDDILRVSVKMSAPAYCYLIAFNPDGTEQLCYPEDPDLTTVDYPGNKSAPAMHARPGRIAELRYPQEQFFEPGVAGLQTFVIIASANPLPPYATWRSEIGHIPWKPAAYDQPWRWYFDGQEFSRLPGERGRRVDRGAPREFQDLCRFFQSQTPSGVVQALAFPVTQE